MDPLTTLLKGHHLSWYLDDPVVMIVAYSQSVQLKGTSLPQLSCFASFSVTTECNVVCWYFGCSFLFYFSASLPAIHQNLSVSLSHGPINYLLTHNSVIRIASIDSSGSTENVTEGSSPIVLSTHNAQCYEQEEDLERLSPELH